MSGGISRLPNRGLRPRFPRNEKASSFRFELQVLALGIGGFGLEMLIAPSLAECRQTSETPPPSGKSTALHW